MYVRNREVCWKKGDFSSFTKASFSSQCRKRVFLRGTQLFLILEHLACLLKLHSAGTGYLFSLEEAEDNYRCGLPLHRKSSKGLGSVGKHTTSATGYHGHISMPGQTWPWRTQGQGVPGSCPTDRVTRRCKEPPAERGCWDSRDPASSWERNHRWPPRIETHAFSMTICAERAHTRTYRVHGP